MDNRSARESLIRETKNNLILDSARKVFSKKGFHETRLEDIGEEAGFSKAALYNYYTDKEEIYLSVAVREYKRLGEKMESIISDSESSLESLRKMIRTAIFDAGEHFAFALAAGNFEHPVHLQCRMSRHEKLGNEFVSVISWIGELAGRVIQRGKDRGEIVNPLDTKILVSFVMDLIHGVFYRWKLEGKTDDAEVAVSQVFSFVKNALCSNIE